MGKRSSRAVAEKRRAIVRTLMARGLEQHEILATLEQEKYADMEIMGPNGVPVENPNFCGNPKTGEPVTKSTISRDWNHALELWHEQGQEDVQTMFERQLAEIIEAKRAAWAAKNLNIWAALMKLEMKLTGTARPEKFEHDVPEHLRGKIDSLMGLFQGMRKREE